MPLQRNNQSAELVAYIPVFYIIVRRCLIKSNRYLAEKTTLEADFYLNAMVPSILFLLTSLHQTTNVAFNKK